MVEGQTEIEGEGWESTAEVEESRWIGVARMTEEEDRLAKPTVGRTTVSDRI